MHISCIFATIFNISLCEEHKTKLKQYIVMTKEEIFSTLKAKLGTTSLSERTINDYITNVMPTEGDPDEAWFTAHSNILKSVSGNFNRDVALQVEDFKKNFKPTPSPEPNPNPQPEPTPQPNAEVDALRQQMEQMMQMMKGMQNKNAQDTLRNSIIAKCDSLGANQGLWKMAVAQTEITEGMDEESFLTSVKERYESTQKEVFGTSASPYGNNGNPEEESKQEIDDFFASKGGCWANK